MKPSLIDTGPMIPGSVLWISLQLVIGGWSVSADDTRPPASLTPPLTAYAQAGSDGRITLRMAESSGETIVWRLVAVRLNDPEIKVRDTAGKPVASDRVVTSLKTETAVLVSPVAVDRFHLLTTRPGTLVFTVPTQLLPGAGRSTTPGSVVASDTIPESEVETSLLKLANAEREKAKVPALTMSPLLLKAARQHSGNMVKQGRLEHQLDGKSVSDRLNDLGYPWRACGENIALGPRAPAEAIRSWMESPGHRANLLSADFTQIGVATKTDPKGEPYWTMVLAAPR